MECKKHNHLVIGGGACHVTGKNTCDVCGAEVSLVNVEAEYNGHVVKNGNDAAHFSISDNIACTCGRKIVGLFDMCE